MTITVSLEPIIRPGEVVVRSVTGRRPALDLRDDPSTGSNLMLGSNPETKIEDPSFPARVVHLLIHYGRLYAHGIPGSIFYINGDLMHATSKTFLHTGDRIALGKNARGMIYEYKVSIVDSYSRKTPAAAAASLHTPTPASPGSNSALKTSGSGRKRRAPSFADDLHCPVCLEIQVQSITLVPCGHNLCQSCWNETGRTTCMTCDQTVACTAVAHAMNNVICGLVASHPDLFTSDNMEEYHARVESIDPSNTYLNNNNNNLNNTTNLTGTARRAARKSNMRNSNRGLQMPLSATQRRQQRKRLRQGFLPPPPPLPDVNISSSSSVAIATSAGAGASMQDAICID
jgi:hypothetical protein